MIPDLGSIIAVLAIFQFAVSMCRPDSHFESIGHQVFIRYFGLVCILAVIFLGIDLCMKGAEISAIPIPGLFPLPR
jgi:hypothetical protein